MNYPNTPFTPNTPFKAPLAPATGRTAKALASKSAMPAPALIPTAELQRLVAGMVD